MCQLHVTRLSLRKVWHRLARRVDTSSLSHPVDSLHSKSDEGNDRERKDDNSAPGSAKMLSHWPYFGQAIALSVSLSNA